MRKAGIICAFFAAAACAQYVPYFPTEVYFSPIGYTNNIPGCKPQFGAAFSSVRIIVDKDLPSTEKLSNTINFTGNIERYLDFTQSRGYFPLLASPVLRSQYFCTDILTLGMEINGDYELYPGADNIGNSTSYNHYQLQATPFLYIIPTPNSIAKVSVNTGAYRNSSKLGQDYDLYKYDVEMIFLASHNTRFFLDPFVFNDAYYNLPARSADGTDNSRNPNLMERGYGCAFGLRQGSFVFGYTEAAFEYEKSNDMVYDANTYQKFKLSLRFQNQFIAKKYGYLVALDGTRYYSKNNIYGFPEASRTTEQLGQMEFVGDLMFIYNINRNFSLRPEYTKIYKDVVNSYKYDKDHFALTLHLDM